MGVSSFEKKTHFGDNARYPQNGVFFRFCKKGSSFIFCHIFGFKRCAIIVFTILRKSMSRKNLVLELCPKMLSTNQIAGVFKLEYLQNHMTHQPDFLHVKSYQVWLEVDQCILAKYAYIKSWALSAFSSRVP